MDSSENITRKLREQRIMKIEKKSHEARKEVEDIDILMKDAEKILKSINKNKRNKLSPQQYKKLETIRKDVSAILHDNGASKEAREKASVLDMMLHGIKESKDEIPPHDEIEFPTEKERDEYVKEHGLKPIDDYMYPKNNKRILLWIFK